MECCLLREEETRNYVEQRIEKSGVTAILKCSEHDGLWIYSRTKDDIDTAVKILKSTLKNTRITLDNHGKVCLQKGDGTKYLNELKKEYCGRVIFQIQRDELYIVTLDVLHQEIIGKVKNFVDLNTYVEEVLVVDDGRFLYIFSNKKRDIKQVMQQFKELDVEIDIVDRDTRKGFLIKGTKKTCKLAFAQLHTIIDDIIITDKNINDEDFHMFLQSSEGIEKLRNIQLAEKCIIQIPIASDKTDLGKLEQSILAKFRIGNCEIKIIEGDITEQKVDYIVNPTDPLLEHKRGLGRTLVDKGFIFITSNITCKKKYKNVIQFILSKII